MTNSAWINDFNWCSINSSISMVNDRIDTLNMKKRESPSPEKMVERNQHAKTINSPFNSFEGTFFSINRYCMNITIATKTRETLKNVFIAPKPRMSKHAGFKNVAKANKMNRNLIADDMAYCV